MVFGKLTVTNSAKPNDGPLHLHFTDQNVFYRTRDELTRMGYTITDDFWGYAIQQSTVEALKTARMFLGNR